MSRRYAVDVQTDLETAMEAYARWLEQQRECPRRGAAREAHVEAVRDVAADEPCGLQLPVPPAMNRTRTLLRVRADGE